MSLAQTYEFKYPPDKKLCKKHRLATRIWKGQIEGKYVETCECCGRKIGEIDVPAQRCYQSDQLSFLGVGLPLFFSFLRYSIYLLFFLALIFAIFGLYTNVVSQNCLKDSLCANNIFNTMSIINKKDESSYLSIQNYILLTFVVLSIPIFQLIRYRFRKIVDDIDEFVASPADYSMILQRLPENTTENDIRQMIQQRRGFLDEQERIMTENLKVEKIIMSYDLKEYNEQKEKHLKQFKQQIKQGQYQHQSRPNLPRPTVPGYIAVVVFSRQQSKEYFISESKCNQRFVQVICSPCSALSDQRIKSQRVTIKRAPEPDDIIWNNARVTVCQGVVRKIVLGTISFLLLMVGGFAQYGLALMQKDIPEGTRKILVGTLASVVAIITNLILQYFLIYTTFWQHMNTMTKYTQVLNSKLVFQQFLNAGVFVVAANIAANYQTFNLEGNLSETIIQIMILNALTPNISTYVLYKFDIKGKLMRYFFIQKKWMIYTQLEANQLFVLPQPSLPEKYSYIIKTLWLTAFYAPFTPIVVPISILGLIFNYFIQKILFGSAYSAPKMISAALNQSCVELFEFVPLLLSLGEFFIYYYFQKFKFDQIPLNWSVPIWLSIAISLTQLIFPMQVLNKMICKLNIDLSNQPPYSQAEREFEVTYEITNPFYKSNKERHWDLRFNSFKRIMDSLKTMNGPKQEYQMKEYNNGNQNFETDRKISNPFMMTMMSNPKKYLSQSLLSDSEKQNQ